MKAHIVLAYDNAQSLVYTWANGEKSIDFRKDLFEAKRCTISFAATEIMSFLNKIDIASTCSDLPEEDAFNIYIDALDESYEESEFTLTPIENGIKILGKSRTGALYGAYEFLRLQGIRWLSPEEDIIPENKSGNINNIEKEKTFRASMDIARGFTFEGALKDSTKLWFWMARNRLNYAAARPYSAKLQKKLGIIFDNGGHIFAQILKPDNKTESGKTLWEEHKDWYGVDGENEPTKENALKRQFCMSNEGLFDFLADVLIERINTIWYETDNLMLSAFDGGETCMCENCKKLGNDTDKNLNFLSGIRKRMNKAFEEGRIDHNIRITLCSYEATHTIEAPLNGFPQNIKEAGDNVLFWPIHRCYKHTMYDESCSYNSYYSKILEKWKGAPMMLGEYYNVSKFKDIPLLFTRTMREDIVSYYNNGIRGMSYMHIPMVNWGVRNLTQSLYAQLMWDVNTDVDAFIDQYFKDRYEGFADKMREAYKLIEDASQYCHSWWGWGDKSLQFKLTRVKFEGRKPIARAESDDHLGDAVLKLGKKAVEDYTKAYEIALGCWNDEIKQKIDLVLEDRTAFYYKNRMVNILEDDIAGLKYGLSQIKMTILMKEYLDALYDGENTDEIWRELDALGTEMIQMYSPVKYVDSEINIELIADNSLASTMISWLFYALKAMNS